MKEYFFVVDSIGVPFADEKKLVPDKKSGHEVIGLHEIKYWNEILASQFLRALPEKISCQEQNGLKVSPEKEEG